MVNNAIALYGTTRYKKSVVEVVYHRVWKTRKDGIRQRYRMVKGYKTVEKWFKGGNRLTVWGTAEDCARALEKIGEEEWIPKRKYVDNVPAADFLKHPEKYARKGEWVEFEIDES